MKLDVYLFAALTAFSSSGVFAETVATPVPPFSCSLKGNYIAPWGLETKVDREAIVTPGEYIGMLGNSQIEMEMLSVQNRPLGVVRTGFDAVIGAPGANSPGGLPGPILTQNVSLKSDGTLGSNFSLKVAQTVKGRCVHIANTYQFFCSLDVVTTSPYEEKTLKFHSDNFVLTMSYFSNGKVQSKPSPLGIPGLPAGSVSLPAGTTPWSIYLIRSGSDRFADLVISGPDEKRVGIFHVDPESGAVQNIEMKYHLDVACQTKP